MTSGFENHGIGPHMTSARRRTAPVPRSIEALRSACRVDGAITLFYYDDVKPAADWYENVVGFEKVVDYGWLAIFRLVEHAYLGLVSAEAGSQRPIAGTNKGALVTISTRELELWWRCLREAGAVGAEEELQVGCDGRTLEFKLHDPGGYTLEFFEWVETPPPMR